MGAHAIHACRPAARRGRAREAGTPRASCASEDFNEGFEPVIDDQGHPVGIISLNDIARAASAGKVPAGEVASTLAAVSAPRPVVPSAA
jgi:hypothetical protein